MAASDYFNQIQQLYVAYFGRPADPEGQSYWAAEAANSNGNLSPIIANFAISAESNTLLGNLSSSQIVTAIYANIFNRAPEAEGLAYWIGQIESGAISGAQAAWTILQSAGTEDTKAVQNKLAAANAFTSQVDTNAEITGYAGATALAHGRAFLAAIDGATASMDNLQANAAHAVTIATGTAPVPALPIQPPIFSATEHAGVVSFSGSATGDITVTWSGAVGNSEATFGRGGHDAHPISFGSGAASSVTLAATETLAGSASTLVGLTVNGTGTVNLEDTAANLSGRTFAATSTTNDVLTATVTGLPGASTDLTKLTGFETIQLENNTPFSNSFTIADGAGTTINATGSTAVTLGAGGQIFNGSAYNDIVMGGTGNDTISTGLGFNLLLGGGGNDTYNIAATSSNLISDLNTGDSLSVATTGVVTAAGVSAFVATSATVNDGTVQITTNIIDSVVNLSLAGGSNGFTVIGAAGNDTITGSAMNDTLTGGAGVNTLTGGGGTDSFVFSTAGNSTLAAMTTITDYRVSTGANAGAADTIDLTDFVTVATNINAVQDLSAQASLASALNVFANASTTNNGLGVFIWGGDTYAYVESTGSTTTYVATDTVIKLSGVPFIPGTSIVGLGIDGV